MANGILGASIVSASTVTTIYTVPTGVISSISVNVCNYNKNNPASARLHIDNSATSAPRLASYLDPSILLPVGGSYERTGLVLAAGQVVQAYTDYSSCVAVQVYGFEESAS